MDKQIEKMVKLIQNNPDLPVIAVIGKGVTASDDYHGQAGRIVVREGILYGQAWDPFQVLQR